MKRGLQLKSIFASAAVAGLAVAVAHAQLNANLREQITFDVPNAIAVHPASIDVASGKLIGGLAFDAKIGQDGHALSVVTCDAAGIQSPPASSTGKGLFELNIFAAWDPERR